MRRNKGGSIEGIMDGGREGGIRNREHLLHFWRVPGGFGGFWEFGKALDGYGWPWPALGGFVRFQFLPDMFKKKFAEIPR